jgi:hypothetical protein
MSGGVPQGYECDAEVGLCHGFLVEAFRIRHRECQGIEALVRRKEFFGKRRDFKIGR